MVGRKSATGFPSIDTGSTQVGIYLKNSLRVTSASNRVQHSQGISKDAAIFAAAGA
jgi:hypothetical protein